VQEVHVKGVVTDNKEYQTTTFDIDDENKAIRPTYEQQQKMEFDSEVQKIMEEKLKNPNCLINADELASHISIMTTKSGDQGGKTKQSGTTSSNSRSGKGASKSKINSSQSNLKESTNKSATSDKLSGTSASQSQTNAVSSETQGDYGTIKKSAEFVNEELPETMIQAVRIIERLLTQSQYHEQHVLYKDYPAVKLEQAKGDDDEDQEGGKARGMMRRKKNNAADEERLRKEREAAEEAKEDGDSVKLKHLFKFQYNRTDGRNVSCMDINSINHDLIAVGYGEYEIDCPNNPKPGLLCFWTLKNPQFPEKIYQTQYSITCCAFSKKNPHLVAVGDSQGNIAIFNCCKEGDQPIADSKDHEGKHRDIVWQVMWVEREKGEVLISVSGDGRVIEWTIKKGLEFTELMQLKRETNPNQKDVFAGVESEKKGGMTFINTGGMCIDFPRSDKVMNYFIATEDCTIHKCSVSYSEQTLATYTGHQGPIYRVACNPFWHPTECNVFMTCSYDWTVKIWVEKEDKEKLTCH
jgi:hypothetical protein